MTTYSQPFKCAVELVNQWGASKLPNGKTLREHLTFENLSIWDLIMPELALYHVTIAISQEVRPINLLQKIRPSISLSKHEVLNLIKRVKANKAESFNNVDSKFLFLGLSAYMYRDVLHPIAKKLREKDVIPIVIHDGQIKNDYFEMDGIITQSIWQYSNKNTQKEGFELNKKIQRAIHELYQMNVLESLISFNGESLWPKLQNAFNWLFRFHFKLIVPQIILAKELLMEIKPSIIISSDIADQRTRIYNLLGIQHKIPVLEVQFGPLEDGFEWKFMLADKVVTWGDKDSKKIIANGVPKEVVTVTGSPRHDELLNIDEQEITEIRNKLDIPLNAKIILCASTYHLKEYNSISDPNLLISMKKAVFKGVQGLDNVYLIVKPHPLEDVKETALLIDKGNNVILLDPKEDIRKYVKACDVFVGFGTTVTIDAMIMNKLIICPVFDGWIWSDLFVDTQATLVPKSEKEVKDAFKEISNGNYLNTIAALNSARLIFLEHMLFKTDGHSAKRIADIACKLAFNHS